MHLLHTAQASRSIWYPPMNTTQLRYRGKLTKYILHAIDWGIYDPLSLLSRCHHPDNSSCVDKTLTPLHCLIERILNLQISLEQLQAIWCTRKILTRRIYHSSAICFVTWVVQLIHATTNDAIRFPHSFCRIRSAKTTAWLNSQVVLRCDLQQGSHNSLLVITHCKICSSSSCSRTIIWADKTNRKPRRPESNKPMLFALTQWRMAKLQRSRTNVLCLESNTTLTVFKLSTRF